MLTRKRRPYSPPTPTGAPEWLKQGDPESWWLQRGQPMTLLGIVTWGAVLGVLAVILCKHIALFI